MAAADDVRSFAIRRFAFAALLGAAGLAGLGAAVMPGTAAAGEWYGSSGYGYHQPDHRSYYGGSGWGSAATPGLDRHRWQQEQWQRYGQSAGRISPWESRRIDRAQAGLARHEGWARADGVVTRRERWELNEHARRVDGLIARSMQNGYGYGPYGRSW